MTTYVRFATAEIARYLLELVQPLVASLAGSCLAPAQIQAPADKPQFQTRVAGTNEAAADQLVHFF